MKITKKQLKRIILEEIGGVMSEEGASGGNEVLAQAVVDTPDFKQTAKALEGKSHEEVLDAARAEIGDDAADKIFDFIDKVTSQSKRTLAERDGDIFFPALGGLVTAAIVGPMLALIGEAAGLGLDSAQLVLHMKWAGLAAGMVLGMGDVAQQAGYDVALTGKTRYLSKADRRKRDAGELGDPLPEGLEEAIRKEIARALR